MKRIVKIHLITGVIKKIEFEEGSSNELYEIFYCDRIEGTETYYKKSYYFPINSIVFMEHINLPEEGDLAILQKDELNDKNENKERKEKERKNNISI